MKEENSQKIENEVMNKIHSGKIQLRSKYVFWAEKMGLGTAFTLSVVLAALLFNLILFYIKETDNFKYLSFGGEGLSAFLESFPYLIVIIFIIFIVLASYLISKSDSLYKKSFNQLVTYLIVFIMVFGGILTYTNIAERIERETLKESGRFFRPLMAPPENRDKGIAGIIYETSDNYLILKTPQGLVSVDVKELKDFNVADYDKGKFVIGIGNRYEHNFIAQKLKVVEKDDMPVIKRGIENKFEPMDKTECPKSIPSDIMYFGEEKKKCIKDCLDNGKCINDCFADCHRVN